ncbi:hypothetical protein NDU88_005918 [Pleurodeles waltl]|uniref:Uncharacterized protein n=1 Tax=Pleurodeles waltl TaxID=8319 RepID=A0AAV7WE27_PLEWA|nr:hypothetical protein NDU88_005918 [Pleurodeles waltl]
MNSGPLSIQLLILCGRGGVANRLRWRWHKQGAPDQARRKTAIPHISGVGVRPEHKRCFGGGVESQKVQSRAPKEVGTRTNKKKAEWACTRQAKPCDDGTSCGREVLSGSDWGCNPGPDRSGAPRVPTRQLRAPPCPAVTLGAGWRHARSPATPTDAKNGTGLGARHVD